MASEAATEKSGKKGNRDTAYTKDDWKNLAIAFRMVSLDSIRGAENKGKVFWKNVATRFNDLSNSDTVRGQDALQCLWSKMSADMVTFSGCVKSVRRKHASGTAPSDDIPAALKQFLDKQTKKQDLIDKKRAEEDEKMVLFAKSTRERTSVLNTWKLGKRLR